MVRGASAGSGAAGAGAWRLSHGQCDRGRGRLGRGRSEEHTSELQSLMRISYAVFCLKKKKKIQKRSCASHSMYSNTIKPTHRLEQQERGKSMNSICNIAN